jgi:hypothetical protein
VSTTFDSFLREAFDQVRFGRIERTNALDYSPFAGIEDLPSEGPDAERPTVYRLFGGVSPCPDYAVTDEDILEFVQSLQDRDKRPKNLFDHLRRKRLMFLGCSFPDWLARFFIRTIRGEQFSESRGVSEVLVDDVLLSEHQGAILFLSLYDTEIYRSGNVVEFVDELHRRWKESTQVEARETPKADAQASSKLKRMPSEAIFLSYAREDERVVQKTMAAIEAAGLDTWFDKADILPGARWADVIHDNIHRCSLFVPFITKHTEKRDEGYFREEWMLAVERSRRMARTRPFIFPVVIDVEDPELVPKEFRAFQWRRLAEGEVDPDFVEKLKKDVRSLRAPGYA